MAEDIKDVLLKAASLCRQASKRLGDVHTPQKQASEVVDSMIRKGMIQDAERERYTVFLQENPEKIATINETVSTLPSRTGAIGEVGSMLDKTASDGTEGGADAFDKFLYS